MTDSNEPAFPSSEERETFGNGQYRTVVVPVGGLSKREYFAAMAMQGILSNEYICSTYIFTTTSEEMIKVFLAPEKVSAMADNIATALIAELNKEATSESK